jgi:hypothetical protein
MGRNGIDDDAPASEAVPAVDAPNGRRRVRSVSRSGTLLDPT